MVVICMQMRSKENHISTTCPPHMEDSPPPPAHTHTHTTGTCVYHTKKDINAPHVVLSGHIRGGGLADEA